MANPVELRLAGTTTDVNTSNPLPVSQYFGGSAVGQSNPLPVASYPSTSEYETVAASQTDQALGATGATGDYLEGLLCVVATAATAAVSIKDGAGSAISVFPNSPGAGVGTNYVPVMARSTAGAWKVTTGAGVSVFATGNFT